MGLSPDNAKVLVGLDVNLQELRTLRNLQQGVAYALSRIEREEGAARPVKSLRPAAAQT